MPATRAPIYKRSPSAPRPRPVSRSQVSHVPVAGPVGFRCSAGRGRPTRPPPKSRSLGDTCSVIPARPAQPPPKPRSLGDTCSVIPAQPAQPPPKPRSRGGRTLAALLGRSLTPFAPSLRCSRRLRPPRDRPFESRPAAAPHASPASRFALFERSPRPSRAPRGLSATRRCAPAASVIYKSSLTASRAPPRRPAVRARTPRSGRRSGAGSRGRAPRARAARAWASRPPSRPARRRVPERTT